MSEREREEEIRGELKKTCTHNELIRIHTHTLNAYKYKSNETNEGKTVKHSQTFAYVCFKDCLDTYSSTVPLYII